MSNRTKTSKLAQQAQEKMDIWQKNNAEFKASIEANNLPLLEELLDKGYPLTLSNYLTDEELIAFGEGKHENLSDNFYEEMLKLFDNLFADESKSSSWELITSYLIYQKHDLALCVRGNYFTYTKNYSQALHYIEQLINNFGFLSEESHVWMQGALYNDNDEFFNQFCDIYKLGKNGRKNASLFPLKGRVLEDGKYYNMNSWKKYFENNYSRFEEDISKKKRNEDSDLYSAILLELLDYPTRQLKLEKNVEKVQPIIDFLVNDYTSYSEINKFELIMVGLLFEQEKDLQWAIDNEKINLERELSNFRLSFLERSLEKVKKEELEYINKAIGMYDPYECLRAFDELGVPSNRYPSLERYIELSEATDIYRDVVKIKKTKKI